MADTTNLATPIPVETDYDTWGIKYVAMQQTFDRALGTTAVISATGGTVVLDDDQNASAILFLNGTLVSNLTVEVKDGRGRSWQVWNATSGAFTVTIRNDTPGDSVTVDQGKMATVSTDGSDCWVMDLSTLSGSLAAGSVSFAAFSSGVVLDEDDFASNSDTALATQQSIRAFVENAALSATLPDPTGHDGEVIGTIDGVTVGYRSITDLLGFTPSTTTRVINTQTGATYTFVLADAGKIVEGNRATPQAFTIPPQSTEAFPNGSQIDLSQIGAGQISLLAGAGVTINSKDGKLKLTGQYSAGTLYKRGTNIWQLVGDLAS